MESKVFLEWTGYSSTTVKAGLTTDPGTNNWATAWPQCDPQETGSLDHTAAVLHVYADLSS